MTTADIRAAVWPTSATGSSTTATDSCFSSGSPAGFRRSELVALDITDVTDHPQGLLVRIRRSKTDQAAGRTVEIVYGITAATCPGRAWRSWLDRSGITAARNAAAERTTMRTTGHTATATLWTYLEAAEESADPASAYLEL